MINTFHEVEHAPLRIFNRAVVMTNQMMDHGEGAATSYATEFTKQERAEIYLMLQLIKKLDLEQVRKIVTKRS